MIINSELIPVLVCLGALHQHAGVAQLDTSRLLLFKNNPSSIRQQMIDLLQFVP